MKVTLDEVKKNLEEKIIKQMKSFIGFFKNLYLFFIFFYTTRFKRRLRNHIIFYPWAIGAFMYSTVSLLFTIIGYIFFRLHIIVDMSDGDLARFYKSFSIRGS